MELPNQDFIEMHELARGFKCSIDYIQKRMSKPEHPEHIPSVKVGRKRYAKKVDVQAWVDSRRTVKDLSAVERIPHKC